MAAVQPTAYPPQPPPAYAPPPQPPPQPQPQPTYNTYNQYAPPPPAPSTTVVLAQPAAGAPRAFGSCPFCGGMLRNEFTLFGILLAILFFPIGILCCLGMMELRCTSCRR